MNIIRQMSESLLHLAFPQVCEGCGTDLVDKNHFLCLYCYNSLPQTNFHLHADNPMEKIFWGRLPLRSATSQFYFTKRSLVQHLLHQLKYRHNKELGQYLGRLMGYALAAAGRFSSVDILVPLPLFRSREKKRGYNQSMVLCEGVSEILRRPIQNNLLERTSFTETQTRKGRVDRWQNMEGRFALLQPEQAEGKHVLLVDDVVTTGATLESCGRALLQVKELELSIATLCFASGN
jgi:ComF family protein